MSFMDVMYGPLGQVNNQFQQNLAQNQAGMAYEANQQAQQAALAQQNQQAIANASPTPPGYGQVAPYPSFGEPSGPGSVKDPFTTGTQPYYDPGNLPTSIPGANYPTSYIQSYYGQYGSVPTAAEWPSYVSAYGDPGAAASAASLPSDVQTALNTLAPNIPSSIPGANYPSSYIQSYYENYGSLPTAGEWPSYVAAYGDPGATSSYAEQPAGSGYNTQQSLNYPTTPSGTGFAPSSAADQYIQAHIERYGYAPDQAYLEQTFPGYGTSYFPSNSGVSNPAVDAINNAIGPQVSQPPTDNSYGYPGGIAGYPQAAQDYIRAHTERYGYAPDQAYLEQTFGAPSYGPLGQQNYFDPNAGGGYTPQTQLNPMEQYIQAHTERYGYAPDQNYLQQTFPQYYGAATSPFDTGAPEIPYLNAGGYMDAFRAQQAYDNVQQILQQNPDIYTPQVQSYIQGHEQNYGYDPDLSFFAPGGGWDQMYGSGVTGSAFNNAYAQMPPDQTDYTTAPSAQPAADLPAWTRTIPTTQRNDDVTNAITSGMGDPAATAQLIYRESNWGQNPGTVGGNYGAGRMAPDDFKLSGGTLNGMTYDQYVKAPLAAQIGAYNDFFNRFQTRNPGLDITQYDAATQYAIRQAANFTPWNPSAWLPSFLAGNSNVQITPKDQGGDIGIPTINSLIAIARSRGL